MNKKRIEQKIKEVIQEALIFPLTMREIRKDLELNYRGEDVCPNCGSPDFMSGELKTFDFQKEWYEDGDDDDTYVYVCCNCDIGRFHEPEEREELKFWTVQPFWASKLTHCGERVYADAVHGYVWECKDDCPYYDAPVWRRLAIEMLHITNEWRDE